MENREIEFTIKANTQPIESSMSKLIEDVGDGTKSVSQFAKKLESMSSIKIDGITKALNNELKASQVVVADIKKELNNLNVKKDGYMYPPDDVLNSIKECNSELVLAQNTATNFSNALDTSKISQGMADLDTTFADYISDLNLGIGDMQQFQALIDNATRSEMKDITKQLRAGLNESENELSELQMKLISAIQFDASPKAIEHLQNEVKDATNRVNEFKKALATVGKEGSSQGGILSGMFNFLKGKVDNVGEGVSQLANKFKRIAISSAVFSALGVIRSGLSDAVGLSDTATNTFTAMGNVIAGSLIPIVEAFAGVVRKAIVWVAGLVKFVTGFNMLQAGIDATNKNIQKIGTSAKKSGKQVKDGLLSGLDEITNIEQDSGGSSGGGGVGADMGAQLGALDTLEGMMEEMNALDFSWAEPLKAFWEFLCEYGDVLAIVLAGVVVAILAVNVAMWVMSANPIVLIIAAIILGITALIAIIVLCVKHWDEICKVVEDVATAIWNWILDLVTAIGQWFADLWNGIVEIFSQVVDFFVGIFTSAWDGIVAVWNGVVAFFKAIWDGIVFIFNAVVNYYKTIFTTAWNVIKTVWNVVVGWFKGVWDGIVNVFSGVGNWFKNVFTSAYNGVVNVFSKITGFFKGIWDSIKEIFSKVGQVIGNAITDTVKKAVNTVLSMAVKIINGFISAINIAIDVINAIPGVSISRLKKLEVPSFDVGTDYVPEDMLAMVHKGERITPAKYNDENWNKEVDMSETNALLENLIQVVASKDFSINGDDIGRASVNYINNESRRRGESVI